MDAASGELEAPTFTIETHGCKLNVADSRHMARALLSAGYRLAEAGEKPSVYILNGCTVTHVADRKARHALASARRRFPDALIVAAGCMVRPSSSPAAGTAGAGLTVTNDSKRGIAGLITRKLGAPPAPRGPGAPLGMSTLLLGRTRAAVKIQEGCNQVCAYCIVPRVRGRERSVPRALVVREVNALAAAGCREVVLTGTQLGSYGSEIGGSDTGGDDLGALLDALLSETAMPRIRVSSLQPPELTDGLLALWAGRGRGRLCPHFHMPLQAGSDVVLRRMRRRYTVAEFLDAVCRVREAVPDASVTTDVIAGFPGETDEDFEDTLRVVDDTDFAAAHVFPYSVRPGTSAAHMGGQLARRVIAERARRLRDLAASRAARYRKSLIGQVRPVLWEQDAPPRGLTDNYVRVVLAGVNGGARRRANTIENVRLTRLAGDRLEAVPVNG